MEPSKHPDAINDPSPESNEGPNDTRDTSIRSENQSGDMSNDDLVQHKQNTTPAAVDPDAIQEVDPDSDSHPEKTPNITAPIFVSRSYTFPEILTSLGFASMFFVYSAVAYLHPEMLQAAYLNNSIGKTIGHAALAVEASMFVNLFLGALLLIGRRKTMVYALAGSWLIVIAAFKILNLIG